MYTRRAFFTSLGIAALAVPLLEACGVSASTGPAATAAAQAAAQRAAVQAAASTSSAAASSTSVAAAAAPGKAQIPMSIAVRTEAFNQWNTYWAQQWAQKHPEVKLSIATINYNDMAQKQLTEAASNTLQDVVYSGVKWFNYSTVMGVFRPIDDYAKQQDPGMSDFFPDAVAGCTVDGKLYALPSEINTGNVNIMLLNKDLFAKSGVTLPTDNWTVDDFTQIVAKLTNPKGRIFGTDYYPGTYYDFDALERTWGGELFSGDSKTLNLTTNPNALAAAQWLVDLRAKYHAAPTRAETQGIAFQAGQVGVSGQNINAILTVAKTVGNRFQWDAVLFPKGPTGLRGYEIFVVMWSVAAHSRQPELAFSLATEITSKDAGVWAVVHDGYEPNARKSVWSSPEVNKISPMFARALAWLTDGKNQGPFPMPYNVRFSELEDKWENVAPAVWYGETPFKTGLQNLQGVLQPIMSEARPTPAG